MVLLQMPIFLGLYYALQESIHFRLASFVWIENLAAPDMLKWWGENIPFISRPEDQGGLVYLGPFFNLLPVSPQRTHDKRGRCYASSGPRVSPRRTRGRGRAFATVPWVVRA